MKGLVIIKVFNSRIEAQIAKGYLESNKISSYFTSDDEGGSNPFLGKTIGIKLYIKEKDYNKASSLLNKINK